MSQTFHLPVDLEQRLREEAERCGLPAEECLGLILDRYLPPRNRSGISDFELDGVRFQLVRLHDWEYAERGQHAIPIEVDGMFLLQFFFAQDMQGKQLPLGQAHVALSQLFGESSQRFDNYKGSFAFPFALTIRRASGVFSYLFRVHDFRGGLEFDLYKVGGHTFEGTDRYVIRKPYPDEFSAQEISRFIAYVYNYLKGYCETAVAGHEHEPFLMAVRSNCILYGYAGGKFFERQYSSIEAFEEAREAYEKSIEQHRREGPDRYPG